MGDLRTRQNGYRAGPAPARLLGHAVLAGAALVLLGACADGPTDMPGFTIPPQSSASRAYALSPQAQAAAQASLAAAGARNGTVAAGVSSSSAAELAAIAAAQQRRAAALAAQ